MSTPSQKPGSQVSPGQQRLRQLRARHPRFHYEGFSLDLQEGGDENALLAQYQFRLEPDIVFTPKIKILGVDAALVDQFPREQLENLIFHVGLVEMLSYWKAAAPAEIVVHAGALDAHQTEWWLDLLRRGMGEFFYVNQLDWRAPDFVRIVNAPCMPSSSGVILSEAKDLLFSATGEFQQQVPRFARDDNAGQGNGQRDLVLASGGKDTVVTLETLRAAGWPFDCMTLNPTKAALAVAQEAGCQRPIVVRRTIDPKLLALNEQDYLNGHTPFSALLAFLGVTVAALFGHRRVIVSNERSAEEPGAEYLGHPINHQYSKTYEFETKFRDYSRKYLAGNGNSGIEYFSLLRPLYELQIAERFARMPQYFPHFRSCNRGMATNSWCGRCPKCLFVYTALVPFLERGKIISIFGDALFAREESAGMLRTLLGLDRTKPFECVGTREETLAALHLCVANFRRQGLALPAALREIDETVLQSCTNLPDVAQRVLSAWTDDHHVPEEFIRRLRR